MTHFTRKPYELGSRISAAPIGPSREPGEFAEDPGWRERLSSYINHSVLRARSEDGGVTLESIAEEFHLMRRSGSAGKGGKCTGPVLVREGGK